MSEAGTLASQTSREQHELWGPVEETITPRELNSQSKMNYKKKKKTHLKHEKVRTISRAFFLLKPKRQI